MPRLPGVVRIGPVLSNPRSLTAASSRQPRLGAVDPDLGPGDVVGGIGGEEQHKSCHLLVGSGPKTERGDRPLGELDRDARLVEDAAIDALVGSRSGTVSSTAEGEPGPRGGR